MAVAEWDFEMGLVRSQAYCAQAERCELDVRSMLSRHHVPAADLDRIVERLKHDAFLDESRYASAFVADKLRFDNWGRRKIIQALRMKCVGSAVIDDAVQGIDMDLYMEILEKAARNCLRRTKAPDERTRSMKALRSIASRGFEPELAIRFLKNCDTSEFD